MADKTKKTRLGGYVIPTAVVHLFLRRYRSLPFSPLVDHAPLHRMIDSGSWPWVTTLMGQHACPLFFIYIFFIYYLQCFQGQSIFFLPVTRGQALSSSLMDIPVLDAGLRRFRFYSTWCCF